MALPSEIVASSRVPVIGPYSQAIRVGNLVYALFAELFPHAPPVRSAPIVQIPRGLLFSVDAIAVVANSEDH